MSVANGEMPTMSATVSTAPRRDSQEARSGSVGTSSSLIGTSLGPDGPPGSSVGVGASLRRLPMEAVLDTVGRMQCC
ncbi:hypothetical protein FFA01_05330 [Frigoribacterium faeni]|uniref:Uncharacterized protein n=1 Tax=Frigoribacterium faeni TaxID=145483 RepID=A0ABQ0UL65_9MICO|nr:hypothetical protein GCM10025699_64170 [Microbacterium flavescens]GEK82224.1 hypothetical protein FFA01_05330 [Frigoribacterium faeni]